MKSFLVILVIIGSVCSEETNPELVNEIYERNPDDSYYFYYETVDGQIREETGEFDEVDGLKTLKVRGKYSYKGPDGALYEVRYKSGPNGYEPTGDHLPSEALKSVMKNMMKNARPGIKRIKPNLVASLVGG